ncbi:MAG: exo-alpha-sialidase, partial [Candidatus Kapabacteria bacterium]|nr:exo-alpha-sialidase [Candidatus Kapabacteria bacterium]
MINLNNTIVIAILVAISYTTTNAQWQQMNGPNQGMVNGFAKTDSLLYASVGDGGVYKSLDNGKSWINCSASLPDKSTYGVAAHKNIVVVGGWRLYLSTDYGNTFKIPEFASKLPEVYCVAYVDSLLVIGSNYGGLYKISDISSSLVNIRNGLPSTGVICIQYHQPTKELFVGMYDSCVYRSKDFGATWQPYSNGLISKRVNALHILGNKLFAGTDNGVYCTDIDSNKWSKKTNSLGSTYFYSLTSIQNTIIASSDSGRIYLSTNEGQTWSQSLLKNSLVPVHCVFNPDNKVIAGTLQDGVYTSTDNGNTWEQSSVGMNSSFIRGFAHIQQTLFTATDGGIYESENNGLDWKKSDISENLRYITSINFEHGQLAAGVYQKGIVILDTTNKKLNVKQNLVVVNAYYTLPAFDSLLFIATDKGIIRYSN